FHALTGEPPIDAGTPVEHMGALVSEEPIRSVHDLALDVPPRLAEIVARALEKEPSRRYPEGSSFAEDLDAFLGGESASREQPRARWRRKSAERALLALAGVLALIIVAAAGL